MSSLNNTQRAHVYAQAYAEAYVKAMENEEGQATKQPAKQAVKPRAKQAAKQPAKQAAKPRAKQAAKHPAEQPAKQTTYRDDDIAVFRSTEKPDAQLAISLVTSMSSQQPPDRGNRST